MAWQIEHAICFSEGCNMGSRDSLSSYVEVLWGLGIYLVAEVVALPLLFELQTNSLAAHPEVKALDGTEQQEQADEPTFEHFNYYFRSVKIVLKPTTWVGQTAFTQIQWYHNKIVYLLVTLATLIFSKNYLICLYFVSKHKLTPKLKTMYLHFQFCFERDYGKMLDKKTFGNRNTYQNLDLIRRCYYFLVDMIKKKNKCTLSSGTQEKCKQRAQSIKQMIKKKREEKNATNNTDSIRIHLETLIENGNKEQILKTIATISPDDLLKVTFMENAMGVPLVVIAAGKEVDYFFRAVNERMRPEDAISQNFLKQKEDLCRKAFYKLLKLIVSRVSNDCNDKYARILATQLIPLQGSMISQIFKMNMEFEQIKDLIANYKNQVEIVEVMRELAYSLKLEDLAKLFGEYKKYCKGQCDWDKVGLTESDLTIYVLPQLGYNILHDYAKKNVHERFLNASNNEINIPLFNMFNCSGDTPVDIALRVFDVKQVETLLTIIGKNSSLHLSTNCLNKLLNNRNLYKDENKLLQFIKTIKSEDFIVQGYIQRIKIGHGSFDVSEFSELSRIIPKLDSLRDYPLLKYIRNSSKPRPDIVKQLLFDDLKEEANRPMYDNLLECICYVTKENLKKSYCKRLKSKGIQPLISKEGAKFGAYIKKLFEVALHKGDENILCYLVENVFSHIFIVDIPVDRSDYFPHLLRHLIERNFLNAAEILLRNPNKLLELKPSISHQELDDHYHLLKSANHPNLLHHLLFNFQSLKADNATVQKMKQFLKSQYEKQSDFSGRIQDKFVINRLGYLFSKSEWLEYYKRAIPNLMEYCSESFMKDYIAKGQPFFQEFISSSADVFKKFKYTFLLVSLKSGTFVKALASLGKYFSHDIYPEDKTFAEAASSKSVKKQIVKIIKNAKDVKLLEVLIYQLTNVRPEQLSKTASILKLILAKLAQSVTAQNADLYSKLINMIDSSIAPYPTIHVPINSETVNRVRLLASLGFDTVLRSPTCDLQKKQKQLKNVSDYYSRAVFRMIKDQIPFSKVAFYNNKDTLDEFKKLLSKKSFLVKFSTYFNEISKVIQQQKAQTEQYLRTEKNAKRVRDYQKIEEFYREKAKLPQNKAISQGYYNWLILLETAAALLKSDKENSARHKARLRRAQRYQIQSIKMYAGQEKMFEDLAEFLTNSSILKELYSRSSQIDNRIKLSPPGQQLNKIDQQSPKDEDGNEIDLDDSSNEANSPQQSKRLLTRDSRHALKDLVDIISQNHKIVPPQILELLTPQFYHFMNFYQFAGQPLRFLSLIAPKLKDKSLIDIFSVVLIKKTNPETLKHFLTVILDSHPKIYTNMVNILVKKLPKSESSSQVYECLKKVYFRNEEMAYQLLLWSYEIDALDNVDPDKPIEVKQEKGSEQDDTPAKSQKIDRYNFLLKLYGPKGYAPAIMTLLFILPVKKPCALRLYDDKKLINYNGNTIEHTFTDSHFNIYVDKAIELAKKYPKLNQNLDNYALNLIKAGQWDRSFILLNKMLSSKFDLTNVAWEGFKILKIQDKNEKFDKVSDILYRALIKQSPNRPQYLKEVPKNQYGKIITLRPQALLTLKVQNLNLQNFIELLLLVYRDNNSVKLHDRLVKSDPHPPESLSRDFVKCFKKLRKDLRSQRIEVQSKNYYSVIIKHIEFIRKFLGYEYCQNELNFELGRLRRYLMIRLQTDPSVQCIFQNASMNYLPLSIVTSKQVTDISNLLIIYPNLLNSGTEKSEKMRKYLIKYAHPKVLKDVINRKLLNVDDCSYVSVSGDIEAAKMYFQQMGIQKMKPQFDKQENMIALINNSNQDLCIEVVKLLQLEDKLWNFEFDLKRSKVNVLFIIGFLRKTKLFNMFLAYFKAKSQLDAVQNKLKEHLKLGYQGEQAPQTAFSEGIQAFFYEYLSMPLEEYPTNLPVSMRYYQQSDIKRALEQIPELPNYVAAIKTISDLRGLIAGILKEPINPNPKQYTLNVHHFIQRVVFKMEKGLDFKELQSDQVLQSLKYLAWGFEETDFKRKIFRPLLVVVALYDEGNQKLVEAMHTHMKKQASIARFLRSRVPPRYPVQISRFLDVVLTMQINPQLASFLFKHLNEQVMKIININHIIGNLSSSFILLPSLFQQNKIDLIFEILSLLRIQSNTSNLFTMLLIISSNYPTILPRILSDFEKTTVTDLFLSVSKDCEPYYFAPVISKIEQLSTEPNSFREYANSGQKAQEVQEWIAKLEDLSGVKGKVSETIKQQVNSWKEMRVVRVRLGMIMLYQIITRAQRNLKQQVELYKNQLELTVEMGTYDRFDKSWVKAHISHQKDKKHSIQVQCIIQIELKDFLHASNNIDQYLYQFIEQMNNLLYLTINTYSINESFERLKVANGLPFPLPTPTPNLASFEQLPDITTKQRYFNKQLFLQEFFDTISCMIFDSSLSYKISDLSAPHRIDKTKVFPELYAMVEIPSADKLMLVYKNKSDFEELKSKGKAKISHDIRNYVKMMVTILNGADAPSDMIGTAQIYYNFEEASQLKMLASYFSNWNVYYFTYILQSLFRESIGQLGSLYMGISYEGFLKIFQPLLFSHPSGFFQSLKLIATSPNFIQFMASLITMMATNGPNLISVVKGVSVDFVQVKEGGNGVGIFDKPQCKLQGVKYKVVSGVLVVEVGVSIKGDIKNPEIVEWKKQEDVRSLLQPKDFMECIFSTPEQLTNYFLDRRSLDNQLHKIAKTLTKLKGMMIHLSIDYNSLYTVIKKLEKNKSFEQLKAILLNINTYVSQHLSSRMIQQYQSLSLCSIYLLYLQSLSESIQQGKDIQKILTSQSISYPLDLQELPLQYITNAYSYFKFERDVEKDAVTNKFVLQIFKSYFMTHFAIGNVYLFGMKSGENKLVVGNNKTVAETDMANVDWVMWVTDKIPEDTEFDLRRLIRVFMTDLGGNMYKVNEKMKAMLVGQLQGRRSLEINTLIAVLPTDVTISFTDDLNFKASVKSLANNFSQQTVSLKVNPETRSVKYCSFAYPRLNFAQEVRLSGRAQQRMEGFRKVFKELFEQSQGKRLTIGFGESLKVLPEATEFESILGGACYELEKAFDEFARVENRDGIVEENVSILLENISLNKNYISFLRLEKFDKEFKEIRLEFTEGSGNSVKFSADSVIVRIDVKSKAITFGTILQALVEELSNRCKPQQIKGLDFSYKNNVKTKDLPLSQRIRILDILLLLDLQMLNCEVSRRILQSLNKPVSSYMLSLDLDGESEIIPGSVVTLKINFKQGRKIFTFSNIVAKVLNLTEDPLVNGAFHAFTEYSLDDKNIHVYNCNEKIESIVSISKKPDRTVKLDKNPQANLIPPSLLLISPGTCPNLASNPNCIYMLFTAKTLLWNSICPTLTLNQPPKSTITLNQPITFTYNLLTNEYNTLPIDKLELNYRTKNLFDVLRKTPDITFKVALNTRNLISIRMSTKVAGTVGMLHPKGGLVKLLNVGMNQCTVEVKSLQKLCIDKTEFFGVKKGSTVVAPVPKKGRDQNMFKQPPEKLGRARQLAGAELENVITQAKKKPLSVAKNQMKFITAAGEARSDVFKFFDQMGNAIDIDPNEVVVYFELNENPSVRIRPAGRRSIDVYNQKPVGEAPDGKLYQFKWNPQIRGRYRLNIDDIIMDPGYEILVSADPNVSLESIIPYFPKQLTSNSLKLEYFQPCNLSVKYQDKFNNIIGDVEHEHYLNWKQDAFLKLESVGNFHCKTGRIDSFGMQTFEFYFKEYKTDAEVFPVRILAPKHGQIWKSFEVKVSGLSMEKKKEKFVRQVAALPKKPSLEININRYKFIEDLTKFENTSLDRTVSVRFDGEPGIDAGGLRREFYDLVGAQLKNQKLPFMKPVTSNNRLKYFLNPQLLKSPKQQLYMKIFGKFIANSIIQLPNNYLIGVDFALPFVKAIFGEELEFDDIREILDPAEFARYKSMLELKPDDFQAMMLDFTMQLNGRTIQLCDGGSKIAVTADNIQEYLKCRANWSIKPFDKAIKSFLEGFNSVMPFDLIKKWFNPEQFHILTCGHPELTADIVLQVLQFQGGDRVIQDWFKRYIREATPQVLKDFLKFTTGSSSIPFDTSSYQAVVEFERSSNLNRLPISHTCCRTIEVPIYKSYEVLAKKLTAAFTLGSEGFGFG